MLVLQNRSRPDHELESDELYLPGGLSTDIDDAEVKDELQKLKMAGYFEEEEEFLDNPVYSPTESVGMISWGFAAHLRTPKKAHEKMQEHFASTLGYNIYCSGFLTRYLLSNTTFFMVRSIHQHGLIMFPVSFSTSFGIWHQNIYEWLNIL